MPPTISVRVPFRKVELLAKGENYDFQRLITLPYTQDVVEHLIRYHFGTLESLYQKNEDILTIWCDLTRAIRALPADERRAIVLMIRGYKIRDIDNGIAYALGVKQEQATKIVKRAYRHISEFLL